MPRPRRPEVKPRLLEFRQRAQLTQEQVAESIGVTAEMVRRHERGLSRPIAKYRERYCELFQATKEQLGFQTDTAPQAFTSSFPLTTDEDIAEIVARVHRLESGAVGVDTMRCLELAIDDFVARYEKVGPKPLTPSLTAQRQSIETLIDNCRNPSQRQRLFKFAGQTSGLLAYMAVNRGLFPLARAYCIEAFQLASFAADRDLQAWVRGTQSFCEYYASNYELAFEFARDGQSYAGAGPQGIRLVVNGEARALGKLGNVAGVHSAVERAYELATRSTQPPGVSPCISFNGYSHARTASNAATAYVALGLPEYVSKHADIAMPVFEASESKWSQSLIRLDLANSIVASPDGDAEEAGALVQQALSFSAGNPITSVVQRSNDFNRASKKWNSVKAIKDAQHAIAMAQLA
jgi:transcriptional regulator with XRE-family HTH domain